MHSFSKARQRGLAVKRSWEHPRRLEASITMGLDVWST